MLEPVKPFITPLREFNFVSETDSFSEITESLKAPQVTLNPKFLYNRLGSQLFEAICELPEYYLTRTEDFIFNSNISAIKKAAGTGTTLIDLGAGNCAKAAKLFNPLKPQLYVPIDVSSEFLLKCCDSLKFRFTEIPILPLAQDFSKNLRIPAGLGKKLFFYPGSSIGNFMPDEALGFLQKIKACCEEDSGVLLGVDLLKNENIIEAAYDDDLGVTAAFNLNILNHLNEVAGTDFSLKDWQHRAFFNRKQSRLKMHVVATNDVIVHWKNGSRRFKPGEFIHTENSYKYSVGGFIDLVRNAGFKNIQCWSDPKNWFLVVYASAGE